MKLTEQQRIYGKTRKGGYVREQTRALGLHGQLQKGWPHGDYTPEQIDAFMRASAVMKERERNPLKQQELL